MYSTEGREVAIVAVLVDGERLSNITHINVQYTDAWEVAIVAVLADGEMWRECVDLILMKIKKT
jgi:hypothetical protein